jgi:hypothetical protein
VAEDGKKKAFRVTGPGGAPPQVRAACSGWAEVWCCAALRGGPQGCGEATPAGCCRRSHQLSCGSRGGGCSALPLPGCNPLTAWDAPPSLPACCRVACSRRPSREPAASCQAGVARGAAALTPPLQQQRQPGPLAPTAPVGGGAAPAAGGREPSGAPRLTWDTMRPWAPGRTTTQQQRRRRPRRHPPWCTRAAAAASSREGRTGRARGHRRPASRVLAVDYRCGTGWQGRQAAPPRLRHTLQSRHCQQQPQQPLCAWLPAASPPAQANSAVFTPRPPSSPCTALLLLPPLCRLWSTTCHGIAHGSS